MVLHFNVNGIIITFDSNFLKTITEDKIYCKVHAYNAHKAPSKSKSKIAPNKSKSTIASKTDSTTLEDSTNTYKKGYAVNHIETYNSDRYIDLFEYGLGEHTLLSYMFILDNMDSDLTYTLEKPININVIKLNELEITNYMQYPHSNLSITEYKTLQKYTYVWDAIVNYYLRYNSSDSEFLTDSYFVNRHLLYGNSVEDALKNIKNFIVTMDNIFEKATVVEYPMVVYRGEDRNKKDKIKKSTLGYISTSKSVEIAVGFSENFSKEFGIFYKFNLMIGCKFLYLERLSKIGGEQEILLPRTLIYKFIKTSKEYNYISKKGDMVEVYEYNVYPSDYCVDEVGVLTLPVYDLPVSEFVCRYNSRTLDGIPLDPITNEPIPFENILNINGRCYDKFRFKYGNHSLMDPISNDFLPIEMRSTLKLKDYKVDLDTFPFATTIFLSNSILTYSNKIYPNIVSLQLANSNISNIEFLKYLPSVISLSMENNSIVDLAPILYLNNIKTIDASYNSITDISFLDSMSIHYITLKLSYNKIKKLYIPSRANIFFLDLNHNNINDISELEILADYRAIYLNLEYNNIKAYHEMFFVNCLDVSVYLSHNKIKEYRYINFKNCEKCTVDLSWNLIACKPSTGKDWVMDENAMDENAMVEDAMDENAMVEDAMDENDMDEKSKVRESKVKKSKVKESKIKESKVKESKVKESKVKESKVKESKVKESKIKESKVKESKIKESKLEKSVKISNNVLVYGILDIGSIIYCESYTLILNNNIFLGNVILEGKIINRLFLSESDNSIDETHTVEIILANNKIKELKTNIFSENRTNLNIILLLQNNNLLSINSLLRNLNYTKVSVDVSNNTKLKLENVEYNSIVDEFILVCNNCNLSGNINLKHITSLAHYYINLDNNIIESLNLETIENCTNVSIHVQNNKLTEVSIGKITSVQKLLLNLNTNIIENIFLKGFLHSVNRFKIDLDNNKINSSDNIFKLDTTPNVDNVVSLSSISQNRKIVGELPRKTPTLSHSNIIISLPNNPIEIKTKVVKMYGGSVLLTL